MGQGLQHWRTFGASILAVGLVIGAYLLAHRAAAPQRAEASTETALLQAIATKDSDNDGLPDWEEALYGTDPNNPDSKGLGMTDGEAVAKGLIVPIAIADAPSGGGVPGPVVDPSLPPVPADGTLTSAFAKNFFTIYMAAVTRTGGNLSDQDMSDVANQALANLSSSIARAPDFKSASDLTLGASGQGAMKAFAASAEAVMNANTSSATTSEIFYLQDAAQGGGQSDIDHLTSIAKAYRAGAAGLAALPVPPALAAHDLALINALARISEIVGDFAQVNTDPLATMLALEQYPDATTALSNAFIGIRGDYAAAGVTLAPGAPGAAFVGIIDNIAASQAKAAKKP